MVPMRDGVELATDIYYPARDGQIVEGPFPTILGRTSYDKEARWLCVEPVAECFAPRGFIVALQDLRGRHKSEGAGQYLHTANLTEGIEWIAAQAWSNGRVGMVGSSHGGIVQQLATLHRPPHLTAIRPDVAPTNIHAHMSREGGAFSLHLFGALFLHAHDAQELHGYPGATKIIWDAMEHLDELVRATPFERGRMPLQVVPNLEGVLFDYYYRGAYDEIWAQECCDQTAHFDRHTDIPGVYSGGCFDPFAGATTSYFATMAKQNATPQRLLMGPWAHGSLRTGGAAVGDVDFGAEADWGAPRFNAPQLHWFERWLRDGDTNVEDDPPVRIFVMGGGDGRQSASGKLGHGGGWRAERGWPLERARQTIFHMHGDLSMSDASPAAGAENCRFTFDPHDLVPTIGGAVTGFYEFVPLPEGFKPELPRRALECAASSSKGRRISARGRMSPARAHPTCRPLQGQTCSHFRPNRCGPMSR